ncbi:hypothetical protein [Vagococcus salmoninarum]|uniref:hypothetical protein n=1 Tax=Vagococcus salmoninarum TaxID=2739 RepID=UPI0018822976|nr:hypothetical protein [Vagococcus salmoninarum]MBE9387849.1 hypothetical protein [Vagococcus salmoninarum]
MREQLNKALIDDLDRKFANRHNYNREIVLRKEELKLREEDDNIGGGSGNIVSNPVENEVVKYLSDPYITNRQMWKRAIVETLNEQSLEISNLMELKYWGEDSWMNWDDFGKLHGYSKPTIYRIRQKVLLSFARKIGEIA